MIRADEFADMMLDLERIADASIESLFALGCAQHDITMNQMRILIELYKVLECGLIGNDTGVASRQLIRVGQRRCNQSQQREHDDVRCTD